MFDAGWLRVTDKYQIEFVESKRGSTPFSEMDQVFGTAFHGRKLRLPQDKRLWPGVEKLRARNG